MKFVLLFDADNTLWDTEYNLVTEPESQLDILRKLDRKLFNTMGRFE